MTTVLESKSVSAIPPVLHTMQDIPLADIEESCALSRAVRKAAMNSSPGRAEAETGSHVRLESKPSNEPPKH
jgi:hypothetical protein